MLFLIPAYLSEESPIDYFAPSIKEYILKTDYFFVENEKTARKVIKFFAPEKKQSDLKLFLLDKYSESNDLKEAQKLMKSGQDFGLLSEAGLPCIADPGNLMVKWCHENNIKVIDILPGATETPIWHEKVRAKYSEKMMQPAGLARHIVNFLSDDSNIVQEEVVFRPVTGNL